MNLYGITGGRDGKGNSQARAWLSSLIIGVVVVVVVVVASVFRWWLSVLVLLFFPPSPVHCWVWDTHEHALTLVTLWVVNCVLSSFVLLMSR